MTAQELLFSVCHACNDNWRAVMDSIRSNTYPSVISPDALSKYDGCLTVVDDEYPDSLRHILKPPFVIHKDLIKLAKDKVLVIGEDDLDIPNSVFFDDVHHSDFMFVGELDTIFAGLCSCLVVGKLNKHNEIIACRLVCLFLNNNKDIYVRPTLQPSINNSLIKDGAYLFDSVNDLK